ncbi:MAG: PorT family protein [Proteiniphilum sp.]|jgi:hypothetical protein|nr:PorT family protein [Proteiniphilum sp.]
MMSENDIRERFQSKLSDFEAPVPPDGWECVERSLKAVAARTTLRRRWYGGAAAAVLILLVGSVWLMRNPAVDTESDVSASTAVTPLAGDASDSGTELLTAPELLLEPVVAPTGAGRLTAAGTSGRVGRRKGSIIRHAAPGEMLTAWMERMKVRTGGANGEIDDSALRLLAKSPERDAEEDEEVLVVRGDDESLFIGEFPGESGEGTLLLAVNGKGGLTGYQQMVNTPMTLRSMNIPTSDDKYSEINKQPMQAANTAGNVSEMEHDIPASFGITVSKYLSDDLFLETGLVYSYLHSKTRNTNNNFRIEERQKFHYLGIPLNVNYNIFSLNRLNGYISAGGTVEKDIYGEFRKVREGQVMNLNEALEESEEYETTKISQRNLQISVNAGIGLSYPLYNRLRVYGKIGGAYYFDAKNKYKTIYSDRKIVMDLNVGVRYEF